MNNKPENDNSVDAVSTVDNSGNAAAMREALKKCLLYIACVESVGIGTIKINDKVKLNPKKIIKLATEALAALPRNCDNAATWLDLYAHFHAPKGMREMPPEWVDAIAAFCQWLVAMPKEGGAK